MAHRILIVTNRVPYPLRDGGSMAMDTMIQGYKANGWDVFLLAMNTSRHFVDEATTKELYRDIAAFETVYVDNSISYIALIKNLLFSKAPEHADRFYKEDFRQKLKECILRYEPDVVQIESIYLSTYHDTIRDNTDALLIQRLHNIEYQIWQRFSQETKNIFKKYYLSILARRIRSFELEAWQDADLLLPITVDDATVITNTGCSTRQMTTPFGINAGKTQPSGKLAAWAGYHIGAMDWQPNAEAVTWFLSEVFPVVRERNPGFEFHFAGRDMPARLQTGLPEGTYCAGEVSDAETFALDKRILIVPIKSAGGIRVKILEAMANGKLVISTAIGMQGIMALPDEHYLCANTPEEFATAIHTVLSDQEKAIGIINCARRFVAKYYDRTEIAENLSKTIKGILAEED